VSERAGELEDVSARKVTVQVDIDKKKRPPEGLLEIADYF